MTAVLGLAVGTAIGVGAVLVTVADGAGTGSSATTPPPVAAPDPSVRLTGPPPTLPDDTVVRGPAATPRAAVVGFLAAEAAGDLEVASTYLDDTAPADYEAVHADVMAPVRGYRILAVTPADGDRHEVRTDVAFEPAIDPVRGLTPARALVTWAVVPLGDGFGVDLAATAVVPQLPPADGAVRAAREFAADHRRCEPDPATTDRLIGVVGLATALCDAGDAVVASEPTLLRGPEARPFLAAYGPAVTEWARVVTIESPVPQRLVLGPIGDGWTVLGVLRPAQS